VLSFIQEIRDQIKEGLPELAFAELVSKDNIATATLEIQLMELVLKIRRTRPNYDHGLADILRMAGKAAKSMNLAAVGVLDDEALKFDAKRPVLPLDRLTEIAIEQAEVNLEHAKNPPEPATGVTQKLLPGGNPSVDQPPAPKEKP
jgi:hypothetical protein